MKLFLSITILIAMLLCSFGYHLAEHCISVTSDQSVLLNQCRVDTVSSSVGFLLDYLAAVSVLPIVLGLGAIATIFVAIRVRITNRLGFSIRLRNALERFYTSWLRLFGTGVYTAYYRISR
ncbi:MAG: hypothetical protein ACPGO5_00680 [Patescibacteria group bacterium]